MAEEPTTKTTRDKEYKISLFSIESHHCLAGKYGANGVFIREDVI